MDLLSNFSALAVTVVLLASLLASVAVATLAQLLVVERPQRVARQESIRAYYGRSALSS